MSHTDMNQNAQTPVYTEILDDEDDILPLEGAEKPAGQHEGEMSLAAIYTKLLQHGSLKLTIDRDSLVRLRKGLADTKYNSNQKLIKAGMQPDSKRIEYTIVQEYEETIDVLVSFQAGASIRIRGIEGGL